LIEEGTMMGEGNGNADTVRVPLTVEERAERADVMASLLAEIAALDRQRRAANDEASKHIKDLEARLQEHGNVLRDGAEQRNQLDLTFPQEEAAKALHDIAAVACTCPDPEHPENRSPTCELHGIDSPDAQAKAEKRRRRAQAEEAEAGREDAGAPSPEA
jgi:hypothetical protein